MEEIKRTAGAYSYLEVRTNCPYCLAYLDVFEAMIEHLDECLSAENCDEEITCESCKEVFIITDVNY